MTTEIARRAKKNGAQVVALAGTIPTSCPRTRSAPWRRWLLRCWHQSLHKYPPRAGNPGASDRPDRGIGQGRRREGDAHDYGRVGSWTTASLRAVSHALPGTRVLGALVVPRWRGPPTGKFLNSILDLASNDNEVMMSTVVGVRKGRRLVGTRHVACLRVCSAATAFHTNLVIASLLLQLTQFHQEQFLVT